MGTRTVRAREGWNPKQVPRTERAEMIGQDISRVLYCDISGGPQKQQRLPDSQLGHFCHFQPCHSHTQHVPKHTRGSCCNTTRVSAGNDFLPPNPHNLSFSTCKDPSIPHSTGAAGTLQTHPIPAPADLGMPQAPAGLRGSFSPPSPHCLA